MKISIRCPRCVSSEFISNIEKLHLTGEHEVKCISCDTKIKIDVTIVTDEEE